MDDNLPVMLQLKMWCLRGFDQNRKRTSQMRSEGLQTATPGASTKKGVIMLRNDTP